MLLTQEKKQIVNEYIELHKTYFKETGKSNLPRSVYRLRTHTPESKVRLHFGGYNGLRNQALKKMHFRTRENAEINKHLDNKHYKRFIVSTVVEGAPIEKDLLKAMELYAKKNNARILLLWMKGVFKADHFIQEELKELEPYLVTGFKFNKNLEARDFLMHPAQMLPLTGLDRFGNKETSLIVSSTKQMMTSVPRPKTDCSHVIWTTGTISLPKYSKTRAGELARQDNTLGALIVEVESDEIFYIRNVEWIKDSFVDLGVAYYKNSIKKIGCEALVWGDLHLGEECQNALNAAVNQTNTLKAKKVFIHDLLSFNSISHHNVGKYLTKTFIPEELNTLEKELNYAKQKIKDIDNKVYADLFIVQSNHDDFLYKYCDTGEFIKDTFNAILGAKCFIKYQKGINPIEDYINMRDITFLKRDQSYIIKGIECGNHGHNGSNGAKGSPNGFRKSYNKIILGHSHQPKILGDVYYVGTLSKLTLSYNKGNSSWLHSNVAIYENGARQLILWVDKKWRM